MQTRIDDQLAKLEEIFSQIDPLELNKNLGFRSKKNIGVWLLFYALLDKTSQQQVIDRIVTLAKIPAREAEITATIQFLSTPIQLYRILNDYMRAGGQVKIAVNNSHRKEAILARVKQLTHSKHFYDLINQALEIAAPTDPDIAISMSNVIDFAWCGKYKDERSILGSRAEATFHGSPAAIPYLTASDDSQHVSYDIVEYKDMAYHVARIETKPQKESKQGETQSSAFYIIEPITYEADLSQLKRHYASIIANFDASPLNATKFRKIASHHLPETELFILDESQEVPYSAKNVIRYSLYVHFPQLAGMLTTKDSRPTIFNLFMDTQIGDLPILSLSYKGIRALQYDQSGGKVENYEGGLISGATPERILYRTITYTTKNAYLVVYDANQADYYPFLINDPRKNLSCMLTKEGSAQYPEEEQQKDAALIKQSKASQQYIARPNELESYFSTLFTPKNAAFAIGIGTAAIAGVALAMKAFRR